MLRAFHLSHSLNSQRELDSWQISSAHSKRKPQRKAAPGSVRACSQPRTTPDMPRVRSQEMGHGQRVPSLSTPAKCRLFLSANFATVLFHENANGCNVEGVLLPFQPTLKFHRSYNRVNCDSTAEKQRGLGEMWLVLLQGSFWYFQTEGGKKERENHCEVL